MNRGITRKKKVIKKEIAKKNNHKEKIFKKREKQGRR